MLASGRSGSHRKEQERGEDHQTHPALQQAGAAQWGRKGSDRDGEHQQHLGGVEPRTSRPGSQIDAMAIVGMVSPMLAIAEPKARLRLICRRPR